MSNKKASFRQQLLEFIEENQPVTMKNMEVKFPKKSPAQINQTMGNLQQKKGIIFNRTKNKANHTIYSCAGKTKPVQSVRQKVATKNDKLVVKQGKLEITDSITGDPAVIHIMNLKSKQDTAIQGLEDLRMKLDKLLNELSTS